VANEFCLLQGANQQSRRLLISWKVD